MKYLGINAWNLQNDHSSDEIDVEAQEGDLVFEIGGVFFLVQREGDYNNIIAKRIISSKMTFREIIKEFQTVMEENELQYIRVEGSLKRYLFLTKMLPELFGDKVGLVKSDESKERNIFYIKCY